MRLRYLLPCLAAIAILGGAAQAAPVVMDACYRADVAFPQFSRYWKATSDVEGKAADGPLGGVLYVYVRNTTGKPWTMSDAQMEGVSLTNAVAFSDQRKFRGVYPASVYFSKLPKAQIDRVNKAGEPIWWRFDPKTLKPGECGELVVRLRHKPEGNSVRLGIVTKSGDVVAASASVTRPSPRFQAICFTTDRKVVYLYAQHPKPGVAPKRVTMDGLDITSGATIASDPKASVTPIICKLKSPVARASMHCFQAVYPDGSKATGAVRAFDSEFSFGMWGSRPGEDGQWELAREHLIDLATHNINVQMVMVGSEALKQFMKRDDGLAMLKSLGIRRMVSEPGEGNDKDPWGYFLTDEPDAADSRVEGVPPTSKVGSLCQGLMLKQEGLHAVDTTTPGFLNLDFTLRPHHWYVYGQMPDILASDPYYQARLGQEAEYGKAPEKLDSFKKATYIEGVTTICRSSQAPKPIHLLLLAAAGRDRREGDEIVYVTPQEKRIETYYAIGAGAKGISYWWFHGLEKGLRSEIPDPNAVAQWTSIGLMGAELRTVGPILTTACAASVPITAPKELWARTLLRGNDTMVLVCVNDDYNCDMQGINIEPLKDVRVGVTLPSWLKAKSVFEISSRGTGDLANEQSGGKLNLQLGTVDVTRLIVITSDASLRSRLQKVYEGKFKANVEKLMGD